MFVARRYTTPGNPYTGVQFVEREVTRRTPGGPVKVTVTVPADWDQTAVDVLATKYMRRAGVPAATERVPEPGVPEWLQRSQAPDLDVPDEMDPPGGEHDARQVFQRLAGCWAYWGWKLGYFTGQGVLSAADAAYTFYEETLYHLATRRLSPNSPQWFNTGLYWAYGITAPDCGQWAIKHVAKHGHPGRIEENARAWEVVYPDLPAGDAVEDGFPAYTRPAANACLPYSERVNTTAGLIPIGEVVEAVQTGRVVMVPDRNNHPVRVVAGVCNGKRRLIRLHLKDGGELRLTADHVVFVDSPSGPVEMAAGDLTPGRDRLVLSRDVLLPQAGVTSAGLLEVDEEVAWACGLMVGDGFSGRPASATSDTWEVKVNTRPELDRLTAVVARFGLPHAVKQFHWGWSVRGYGAAGRGFWERLGLWGHTGAKVVPEWVYRARSSLVASFLRGLFDADGHASGHEVVLVNTSRDVSTAAHVLLRSMGVFANLGVSEDERDDSARLPCYRLSVADHKSVRLYAERVGFTHSAKAAAVADMAAHAGRDDRPCSVLVEAKGFCGVEAVYDIQTEAGEFWAGGRLVHNCFILGVKDTLLGEGGIYDLLEREAKVFKFGGGAGSNFSALRGEGEPLSGGGFSSGMLSFLNTFDSGAGSIKSGGVTRRAAKMVCVDVDHPDIEKFVEWKAREEFRAACTVTGSRAVRAADMGNPTADEFVHPWVKRRWQEASKLGFDPFAGFEFNDHFEGEFSAYGGTQGQNANNSVRVSNAFMQAVKRGGTWELKRRTDGAVSKAIDAKGLWDKVCRAAWLCADPGLQFDDLWNDWNLCPEDGRINATNPCCFVGGTLVDTSEGRIRIDELARMSEAGEPLPMAFAYDTANGRPVLRQIKRAWKAGDAAELVRVKTDKGVTLTCTPDHRFLTYSGEYRQAQYLTTGTSLRKVARHVNRHRGGRIMLSDRGCGNPNGSEYQSVWMWEQANGAVPDGFEVHHVNGDCGDDRLSNFECKETVSHRSDHARGMANPNATDVTDDDMLAVWDGLAAEPVGNRAKGVHTPERWNGYVRRHGLQGRLPLASSPSLGGRIRGMTWAEFVTHMAGVRERANDKVASVETLTPERPEAVYDIEVDGVHNFGVSDTGDRGVHSLIVHNSEYGWLDDTACNLASVRLTKFARRGSRGEIVGLDVDAMQYACTLATVALDITVSMAGYPSEEVAEGSRKYRTIGLGYCDLGAFLMQAGHAYDSDGGRAWAAALTSLMHSAATQASARLAETVGPFPRFKANRGHALRVVGNHARWGLRVAGFPAKAYDGLSVEPVDVHARGVVPDDVLDAVSTNATTAATLAEHHGLRNAQLTLIAPTGTIGLQLGCDTTGIEPDFALVKDKKLVGGGYFKIVNQGLPAALAALGYDEGEADDIVQYVFGTRRVSRDLADLLHTAGLSHAELKALGEAVKGANSLDDALKAAVHTTLRWQQILGCGPEPMGDPEFRPLPSLLWKANPDWDAAFVVAEAAEHEAEVVGTGTVEHAPHLKPEHYAVFDCATPSGQGKRAIAPMGHVRMMAAAQPALSGGISKTINMPADSTPADVAAVYAATHAQMVKCAALYLDGAKMSQPLNAVRGAAGQAGVVRPDGATPAVSAGDVFELPDDVFGVGEDQTPGDGGYQDAPDCDGGCDHQDHPAYYAGEKADPAPQPRAAGREKLPGRRRGYTQKMRVGRQKVYMRTGEYPDGRLGEIFLDIAGQGSAFRAVGNALAVAVSLGLQHGVPLEEFVDAFVGLQFEPAGVVTDHDRVKMASSVLDAVFRDLAITYLNRDELAHVQPEPEPDAAPEYEPEAAAQLGTPHPAPARSPRYGPAPSRNGVLQAKAAKATDTGGLCPECGNFSLMQTGTCKQCSRCFWHSGCG